MRTVALVLLALVSACGGAGVAAPPPTVRSAPAGEPRSYLTGTDLVLAFDHRAIRVLPFASDFRSLYLSSGLFIRFVGHTGIDPVADIDTVVAGGRDTTWAPSGVVSDHWRVVLRHRLDDADARARLEAGAQATGEPLRWRESQGLRSALLPGEAGRTVPHALLMTTPGELVLLPDDELSDAIATARDHEARRAVAGEAIEPALALDGALARAHGTALPSYLTARGAASAEAEARWDGNRVIVHAVFHFGAAGQPEHTIAEIEGLLSTVRGNAFLSTLGIAGWVDHLTLAASGTDMIVDTSGDAAETAAACRAIALLLAR